MKLRILKYLALLLAPLGLLLSCGKQPAEPVEPSDTDVQIIHYRATVTKGVDTRVSLSGLSYLFSEGDQLYVINTDEGDDAGKLYGVMHLVSGAGKGTAVFEGDLYAEDEFIPLDGTPLSVTLVGAGDRLHTCKDGKVIGTSYNSYPFAASLENAVSLYSHFIATGTFAARNFTLSQKSTFINISITFAVTESAENTLVTLYNNTNESLWSNNVPISSYQASFTAILDGSSGVLLYNALLDVTPVRETPPSYSFNVNPVTLAANYYYNIDRTTIPIDANTLFTIEAPQATTVTFNYTTGLQYSSDGLNWSSYESAIPMNENDVLYFRATGTSYRNSGGSTPLFTTDGNKSVYIYGDIMSLMSGNSVVPANAFEGTFKNVTWISIPNGKSLTLSATTLNGACYKEMFKGSSINKVPVLSASTLAANCYESMFEGCTALTAFPGDDYVLPAGAPGEGGEPVGSLATSCYKAMFKGCTELTSLPSGLLPAKVVEASAYYQMFDHCSSLETPVLTLPATTLNDKCYYQMFNYCSALTFAPSFPGETGTLTGIQQCYQMFNECTALTTALGQLFTRDTQLTQECFHGMFRHCSGLVTVPSDFLPSEHLAQQCYRGMFEEAIFTEAPDLPATELVSACYRYMFYNCTRLNKIICLATDRSATDCTTNWVYGVAAEGSFWKDPGSGEWGTGVSAIPNGWVVKDYGTPIFPGGPFDGEIDL